MKPKLDGINYEISCLHTGVTGSSIILTIHFPNGNSKQVLIDCGTFQEYEYDKYNYSFPAQLHPENIDYVFLTHTHIDHCGRLPFLVKKGYSNNIYCTNEAKEMIVPALIDCVKILKSDAKTLTKIKKKLVEPLYDNDDVMQTLRRINALDYNKKIEFDANISITLLGNGHLMGACMVLLQISYPNVETVNLLFTGDYNTDNLFCEIPEIPKWVKKLKLIVIQESTYGDTSRNSVEKTYSETLISLLRDNKTILSPVIACERAETVLYKLKELQDYNLLPKSVPIYLAGSLACEYFKIYSMHSIIDFIPENLTLVTSNNICIHSEMLNGKNIQFTDEIPEEVLNSKGPKIILTTSGMADKGKAPFYLSKLVHRKDVSVVFTCFLPSNTLGYTLKNCKRGQEHTFNVYGEKIQTEINCEIFCTNEFSSHAKSDQLIDFLQIFPNLVGVFINHGEIKTKELYAQMVSNLVKPSFVHIMDRSTFFSISGFEIKKAACSKYASLDELNQITRKERKDMKIISKKRKIRYKRPRPSNRRSCQRAVF